jgi:PIN domain nuclease of toxin-antitoxin system
VRLLLDTHALVWFVLGDAKLSAPARTAIEDPNVQTDVSVASIWEIAIKVGVGKWPEAEPLLGNIEHRLVLARIGLIPISVAHARHAGLMQSAHRDPFDRLLAAQAAIEGLTVVTIVHKLAGLGVSVLWEPLRLVSRQPCGTSGRG